MENQKEKNNPAQLKIPEGVSPDGPVLDINTAYMQAVINTPLLISELTEKVDEMNDYICEAKDCLIVIAKYFRKKGYEEGIFEPDEFKEIDEAQDAADEGN